MWAREIRLIVAIAIEVRVDGYCLEFGYRHH